MISEKFLVRSMEELFDKIDFLENEAWIDVGIEIDEDGYGKQVYLCPKRVKEYVKKLRKEIERLRKENVKLKQRFKQ